MSIRRIGVQERALLDALRKDIDKHCAESHDTHEMIAQELGITGGSLSQKLQGTANFRLDEIVRIMHLVDGHQFGVHLARFRNAKWIPGAVPVESAELAQVLKETGDVVSEYGAAMSDGEISDRERENITRQIVEAEEALAAFKLSIQKPSITQLHRAAI